MHLNLDKSFYQSYYFGFYVLPLEPKENGTNAVKTLKIVVKRVANKDFVD